MGGANDVMLAKNVLGVCCVGGLRGDNGHQVYQTFLYLPLINPPAGRAAVLRVRYDFRRSARTSQQNLQTQPGVQVCKRSVHMRLLQALVLLAALSVLAVDVEATKKKSTKKPTSAAPTSPAPVVSACP